MVASINGHVNIVKLLIEAKAHLNIQEKEVATTVFCKKRDFFKFLEYIA